MTWSNTATVDFTPEGAAIVSGIGPQLAVTPVTDTTMGIRFVHDDPSCPDVFFASAEDVEQYHQYNPGTVHESSRVRMTRHPVLWMLGGLAPRYYRNLDDVIRHSRALSGSTETP
jgi:hypothetical protein